ncbi:MAG: TauD/TfdA dioxygenase family protein [Burkholderiales bacterium]
MPIFEAVNSSAPIGTEIRGVDLSEPLESAVFKQIFDVLCERSVIVFRSQRLKPQHQVVFSRLLGPLAKPPLLDKYALSDCPEVLKVSNIIENGEHIGNPDAGLFWHSDGAYQAKPSMYSMLYAIEVPEKGGKTYGDTLFTSTAAAYDSLAEDLKRRILRLRAVHSLHHQYEKKKNAAFLKRSDMTGADQSQVVPEVVHPLVRIHPHTGRKCIFVNEGHSSRIEGLPENESRELLQMLCTRCTASEFIYRHQWRPGDLVVWDNCATQHKATFDYELPLRRLMHRTTISGERPIGIVAAQV